MIDIPDDPSASDTNEAPKITILAKQTPAQKKEATPAKKTERAELSAADQEELSDLKSSVERIERMLNMHPETMQQAHAHATGQSGSKFKFTRS